MKRRRKRRRRRRRRSRRRRRRRRREREILHASFACEVSAWLPSLASRLIRVPTALRGGKPAPSSTYTPAAAAAAALRMITAARKFTAST